MPLRFALTLMLLCGGCADERLQAPGADLRASVAEVDFGQAFVGHPVRKTVELHNASRLDLGLRFEVPPPFTLVHPAEGLAAGGRLVLELELLASAAGDHRATMRVESEGAVLELVLSGRAGEPPHCDLAHPCAPSFFDPALGACAIQLRPEGWACASPCVQAGACSLGQCLGAGLSCDDGNPCTLDACDPSRGCVHLEGKACQAPEDPCLVSYCDPAKGCGLAAAADGTACGPADCQAARVCIAGSCQSVPTPDGATCGGATPCQGEGRCAGGSCITPGPEVVTPVWIYSPADDLDLFFSGVVDPGGALYWLECGQSCELVSVGRDGQLRFRTSLPGSRAEQHPTDRRILLRGELVVTSAGSDFLVAVRTSDGAIAWTRNLRPLVMASAGWVELRAFTAGAPEGLLLLASPFTRSGNTTHAYADWLLSLSDTGELLWSQQARAASGLVGDEQGNLYFTALPPVGSTLPRQLVSLTAAGVERFSVTTDFGAPLAVYGQRLYQSGASLSATATGAATPIAAYDTYQVGGYPVTPLLAPGAAYLVAAGESCFPGPWESPHLRRLDPLTGEVLWERLLKTGTDSNDEIWSGQVGQPLLTRSGTVLVPYQRTWSSGWSVNEVSASGETLFSCELPILHHGAYGGPSALHQGRWFATRFEYAERLITQVVAMDLPGLDLAQEGWATYGGSPGGGGRPAGP